MREVAWRHATGIDNNAIAAELSMARSTVRVHLRQIRLRLRADPILRRRPDTKLIAWSGVASDLTEPTMEDDLRPAGTPPCRDRQLPRCLSWAASHVHPVSAARCSTQHAGRQYAPPDGGVRPWRPASRHRPPHPPGVTPPGR
ncbi:LuxR C-terminal-related transcriptional regulator [Yinghuangia sp. YIM S09857]|uniref:LuxR C-terminal-related transcriptional regulator n=1 Tax=Yinghuangia sp. YIM S09857 TaxID=3436929 RepID=UPI003F534CDC